MAAKQQYMRLKTLGLEEGFALMKEAAHTQTETTLIDGFVVSVSPVESVRLGTFLHRGIKCVHPGCQMEGSFFAIERDSRH